MDPRVMRVLSGSRRASTRNEAETEVASLFADLITSASLSLSVDARGSRPRGSGSRENILRPTRRCIAGCVRARLLLLSYRNVDFNDVTEAREAE